MAFVKTRAKAHPEYLVSGPAAAATTFNEGDAVVALNGFLQPGGDTSGARFVGIAVRPPYPSEPNTTGSVVLDNSSGTNGTWDGQRYSAELVYDATPHGRTFTVAGAAVHDAVVFLTGPRTCSVSATTNNVILGRLERPAENGGANEWFVRVGIA